MQYTVHRACHRESETRVRLSIVLAQHLKSRFTQLRVFMNNDLSSVKYIITYIMKTSYHVLQLERRVKISRPTSRKDKKRACMIWLKYVHGTYSIPACRRSSFKRHAALLLNQDYQVDGYTTPLYAVKLDVFLTFTECLGLEKKVSIMTRC